MQQQKRADQIKKYENFLLIMDREKLLLQVNTYKLCMIRVGNLMLFNTGSTEIRLTDTDDNVWVLYKGHCDNEELNFELNGEPHSANMKEQ
jgi:hypothetical protein